MITIKEKHNEVLRLLKEAKQRKISLTRMAVRCGKQEDFFYDYSRRSLPSYYNKGYINKIDYNTFVEYYNHFAQNDRRLNLIKNQTFISKITSFFNK